jgi:hypothetical protein
MKYKIGAVFFRNGAPVGGETVVNSVSLGPDITDLPPEKIVPYVSDLVPIGPLIYGPTWGNVVTGVVNLFKDALKNGPPPPPGTTSNRLILLEPGFFFAGGPAVDEARLTFQAWSTDPLIASFGRVDPFGRIVDLGERRYDLGGIHFYEHSFSIPLKGTPPGLFFFSLATGDSASPGIISSRHSSFLIQSTFGKRGNFEVVVPRPGGGLSHFWRDNDDPSLKWHRGEDFATNGGQVNAVSLIQSNFGSPGRGELDLVVLESGCLFSFSRGDQPGDRWQGPVPVMVSGGLVSGVSGNPALIQGTFGKRGNFEVVVPRAGNGLSHFWRDNDDPSLQWHRGEDFALNYKVDAVSLIQTNFGPLGVGELEVIAIIKGCLVRFRRVLRDSSFAWDELETFAPGVSGCPSLIQGWHGKAGNYELVVPRSAGGLAHYWYNNNPGEEKWNGPNNFADKQLVHFDAVSLIQSNLGQSGLGDLEVVVRSGNRIAHLWRKDALPFAWSDPIYFDNVPLG